MNTPSPSFPGLRSCRWTQHQENIHQLLNSVGKKKRVSCFSIFRHVQTRTSLYESKKVLVIWTASKAIFHQHPDGRNDPQRYPTARIHTLPYEVLLEIFDTYRQIFVRRTNYDRSWNSSSGWFKLAHVCREWRRVVLTSPSRLHLRLVFTQHRTKRAIEMKNLPPLPIIVDYSDGAWTVKTQMRMVSALAQPDRVREIVFRGREGGLKRLMGAMNRPFPALESLGLSFQARQGLSLLPLFFTPDFPPPFFGANLSKLRRFSFTGKTYTLLSQILSYTKSLVELTLNVDKIFFPGGTPLLGHLRDMPLLRHLEVEVVTFQMISLTGFPAPPTERRDVVLLSGLTRLRFTGPRTPVEVLVAGLATPSLKELNVSLYNDAPTFPIPHLSSLIHDAGILFFAAQLKLSQQGLSISMLAHSHPIHDPVFKIGMSKVSSIAQIGGALSSMLVTVEDIFLAFSPPIIRQFSELLLGDPVAWRELFEQFRNVKILRVHHGLETEVAAILQQHDRQLTADPRDRREESDLGVTAPSGVPIAESLDFLPSLKEIEVLTRSPGTPPIGEDKPASEPTPCPFERFLTARKHVGRPVEVFWKPDKLLPRYFCDTKQ
ncbi:hypothetical protein BC827DRAFT_1241111 [Russula dissimulans]|nr:hypothetical protein BC827DRAFT_1241111 [Russula dissimulans]